MLLRVLFTFQSQRTSHLKEFESVVEDSVDSELVKEVEAREELHGDGSREFGNEFNIRECGFMIGL